MTEKVKRVMVCGKFDPPHEGHIDHIVKASKLGDYLIVVAQPDIGITRKKGFCNISFWARRVLLKGILLYYGIKGDVHMGIDEDGGSVESLKYFKPDIFAKGGDRTPDNMPLDEINVCEEIGCEIIYGIGDQLNSSSKMKMDKEVT